MRKHFVIFLKLSYSGPTRQVFCYMSIKVFHLETCFQSYMLYVVVPQDLDVKVKAAMLGAVFLIVSKLILLENSLNIFFFFYISSQSHYNYCKHTFLFFHFLSKSLLTLQVNIFKKKDKLQHKIIYRYNFGNYIEDKNIHI